MNNRRKLSLLALSLALALLITGGIIFYVEKQKGFAISVKGEDEQEQQVEEKEREGQPEVEAEEEKPLPKGEFTDFGDFWVEIHTDKLDLKAPIVEGVENDDLKYGVGRHVTTAEPNTESGNMVISGHRWIPGRNPSYTAFRHIDKLEIGDKVSVFREGKEYVYKVRESKTVSGDAVEILEETDAHQLTLYTCTPLFTALRRLVYIADFIEVKGA